MGQIYTVAVGDLLINLGNDTGVSSPNYNGNGLLTIYSDLAGGNTISGSRVFANQEGEYEYWWDPNVERQVWEVVFNSSNTPVDVRPDVWQALVVGPNASVTDNALVRWSGTDPYKIKNSGATLTDAGALSGLSSVSVSGSVSAGSVSATGTVSGNSLSSTTSVTAASATITDTLTKTLNKIRHVDRYATAGSGTTASPWTGWESAFSSIPTTEDTHIVFTPGVYQQNSAISLPVDLNANARLTISGYGATLKLTASAPRAFDIGRTANDQTFRNVVIEGLTVDAGNVGGRHHVLIGGYINGSDTLTRLNIENVVLRDLFITNVLTDSNTSVNHRLVVNLTCLHTSATPNGEALNTIKHVRCHNVVIEGGNAGINILGGSSAGVSSNILLEDIVVDGCFWRGQSVPTTGFASSGVHIGNWGFCRHIKVTNCSFENGGDVGVEVNSAEDCSISHISARNVAGVAVLFRCSNTTSGLRYRAVIEDVAMQWDSATGSLFPRAVSVFTDSGSTCDSVVVRGVRATLKNVGNSQFPPGFVYLTDQGDVRRISLEDLYGEVAGVSYSSATGTSSTWVKVQESSTTTPLWLSIRDAYFRISGQVNTGGARYAFFGVYIPNCGSTSTPVLLNVNNVTVDAGSFTALSGQNETLQGIMLIENSKVRGSITGLRVRGAPVNDATPRGLYFSGTFDIIDALYVKECDWIDLPAHDVQSNIIPYSSSTLAGKLHCINMIWGQYPRPRMSISVGTSPFTYRNLDYQPQNVTVQGGTVSLIEYSVDNSTFTNTGVTQGLFTLAPGDALRVTYSAAPSMFKDFLK
jgi:hypothetical protein